MLEHLSYSSISKYVLCARNWRFKYLDQIPAPKSTSLLFGGAFHETIEYHVANQGNIIETWATNWEIALAESDGQIDWQDETPESLCNLGTRMLTHKDILPVINSLRPLEIEKRVELQVPGVPIPVVGFIDMIESDGVTCDFKTSSRSWSQSKAQDELQPIFYLAALNQLGIEHCWKFRHYVFTKTKTPKIEIWETQRSPREALWLFELIKDVWDAIQKDIFPTTGVGSFLCSAKYCEYWDICRGK